MLVKSAINYCLTIISLVVLIALTGCKNSTIDRLSWIGDEPPLKKMEDPDKKSSPLTWPVVKDLPNEEKTVNSLWSTKSKEFFRDQRAARVGDIMTVKVEIKDKAELDNKTERKRKSKESLGAPSMFGLEDKLVGVLPGKADPAKLLSVNGDGNSSGEGVITRGEVIETEIAAVVTQVLPNGNMVIYGSQEIRVNFEIRQLTVEGVVRPEDVSPNNHVNLQQMAEARVSYGGKGLISDVQQPRIGSQIIDILSPW